MTNRLLLLVALLDRAACGEGEDLRAASDDTTVTTGTDGTGDDAASEDGEQVTFIMECWRNDDLVIWVDRILPVFHDQHPDIRVEFQPTAPDECNAALEATLGGGTAGDEVVPVETGGPEGPLGWPLWASDPNQALIEDFLAVIAGGVRPRSTGEDGLAATRVALAAARSAAAGRPVALEAT